MSKGDVDKTLWVGNISDQVTEELLFELFIQAGPLDRVAIAKEKDGRQKGFAFVTFCHEVSVPYTIQVMDGTCLFGRLLKLQARPGSIHQQAQQQQQMENLRFNSNPYQNNSPVHQSAYPQSPVQHVQSPLANPYVNQAARTNNLGMSPQFHRSHTWHGNELSSAPQQSERDRDRDMRGGRDSRGHENRDNYDRNRDRGHHHRDRSGGRYRGEPMEDHRNSPASDNFYGGNGFEARRQKVLDKHNRMLQGHRGGSRNDPGRKGHY